MGGLVFTGIRKTFDRTVALDDVSLTVEEGELFFLLGPSGCGKTTLLRIVAGLCDPDAGSVTFRGTDLLSRPIERRNVGMVFQNYALWPHMTVAENVSYGLRMRGVPRATAQKKVAEALAMVDMAGLHARKPAELSGGQQQRVALARALVYEPEILLLDEPLSNLDAKLRKDMRHEISRLHDRLKLTMVYVTHDQEEAASLAQRVALLKDGRLVQVGPPEDLYRYPRTVYAAEFFGRANTFHGRIGAIENGLATVACGGVSLTAVVPSDQPSPAIGDTVALVVRPEDFRLNPAAGERNSLRATVRHREFIGAVDNYILELDSGSTVGLMELHRPELRLRTGDTVSVAVSPDDVRVIREATP